MRAQFFACPAESSFYFRVIHIVAPPATARWNKKKENQFCNFWKNAWA
jgi:hypothetical protein